MTRKIKAPFSGAAYLARRSLQRQHMIKHGGAIEWLRDPALIPVDAAYPASRTHPSPYFELGNWVLTELVAWSTQTHADLPYKKVFATHKLKMLEKRQARKLIGEHAVAAYGPGIKAMTEIHDVIPALVGRDREPSTIVPEVARQAATFGAGLSRDGTFAQLLIRNYLTGNPDTGQLDPAKLKRDPVTGLTTVTPLEELIDAAKHATSLYLPWAQTANTCVALHAAVPELGGQSMFNAVWNAYGGAAQTHIHPSESVDINTVPPQFPPDPNVQMVMNRLAMYHASVAAGNSGSPTGIVILYG